ncbi:MAG: transcriptional regulator [Streptosporangiales bacterium]|nr:transcriptional regulator [Streptosporangiales bacterium]
MTTVELSILGPLEASVDGRAVHLGGPRPRLVLAALLLDAGRVVPVERLVDAVWGDEPPASARALVTVHVSALRKAFMRAGCDDEVIETASGGYRVRVDAVGVDALRVDDAIAAARSAVECERHDEAAALLRAALALWRGPVLEASRPAGNDAGVARYDELRVVALEEWVEAELALDRYREVLGDLTSLVAEHPLRERPRAQLMLALWRSGRPADALDVYQQGRRLLVDELGLEPGAPLRELHEAILRDEAPAEPDPDADTAAPEPRPAELPPAVPAFTGRATELAALDSLLDQRGRHLPVAVVSGVAGVGKTSLAVHWSQRVAERFIDGQLFADLRGHDPDAEPVTAEAVLERFLRALGVPGERIPAAAEDRTALFRSVLDGQRVLILLDNAASAAQVRPLLPGSPGCCVVVTARRRLEGLVAAEGALSVPVGVMDEHDASDLLAGVVGTDRMRAEPDAAARFGALCEGLPLALRIAATRLASRPAWSVADLVDRLSDEQGRLDQLSRDELQVRGSFALSYRELSARATVGFRRLGLLDTPGGFAPWLLAAVVDGTVADADELCEELVDAQLLQPLGLDIAGQSRYRFHDLIRLFARERAESEETAEDRAAALDRAFGAMFGLTGLARLAEQGDSAPVRLHGDVSAWLPPDAEITDPVAWLEAERTNLVAAVAHTADLGWTQVCWSLVVRLVFLFEWGSYHDDWRVAADRALGSCRRVGDRRGEAAMLYALGVLALHERKLAEATEPLTAALELSEGLGDDLGVALALRHLATVHSLQGELPLAQRGFERVGALLDEIGDPYMVRQTAGFLAHVHMLEGRLGTAERLLVDALATLPVREGLLEAQLSKRLAEVYLRQGRGADAVAAAERALGLLHRDPVGEAYVLHALGEAKHVAGDDVEAAVALGRGLRVARQVGERLIEGRILLALGHLDTPDAVDHLREAVEVFGAIDAWTWHAQAVEALSSRATTPLADL